MDEAKSKIISVEPITMNNSTYFAVDGNYGTADGLVVVDTTEWSESDWQAIDEVGDADRANLALALAKSDEAGRIELRQAVEENDLDAQFDKAMKKE